MNTRNFRQILLFFLLVVLISFNDKTEDNDGWQVCTECDIDSWLGSFSGTASHFTASSNTTVEGIAISFASSTKSITATMMVRENQLRLTGNSKKFQVTNDSTIVKEVVEFDVYK